MSSKPDTTTVFEQIRDCQERVVKRGTRSTKSAFSAPGERLQNRPPPRLRPVSHGGSSTGRCSLSEGGLNQYKSPAFLLPSIGAVARQGGVAARHHFVSIHLLQPTHVLLRIPGFAPWFPPMNANELSDWFRVTRNEYLLFQFLGRLVFHRSVNR